MLYWRLLSGAGTHVITAKMHLWGRLKCPRSCCCVHALSVWRRWGVRLCGNPELYIRHDLYYDSFLTDQQDNSVAINTSCLIQSLDAFHWLGLFVITQETPAAEKRGCWAPITIHCLPLLHTCQPYNILYYYIYIMQGCQTLGSGATVGPAKTPIRSTKRLENVIGFYFWTFNCIFISFKPFLLIAPT